MQKKYLILSILCLSMGMKGITAQVFVSKEAKINFLKDFPGASGIKWEKDKAGYEVNFSQNKQQLSAVYNSQGSLQETELTIGIASLPASITVYIKEHYHTSIKEAAKIIKVNGEIMYEAEVNKRDLLFDTNGKFIKSVKD